MALARPNRAGPRTYTRPSADVVADDALAAQIIDALLTEGRRRAAVLTTDNARTALTRPGLFVSDAVSADLLGEAGR